LIGFPALIDRGDGVEIEVFDEPESALTTHQAGLRRLFALQIKDAMKYLEKNLPEQQKMGSLFMPLGTLDELRAMVIEVALNRAFLIDPLPTDADGFAKRLNEGRARLTLIANEVARLALAVLLDYHALRQKIKDSKGATDAVADVQTQLGRLMGKRFLLDTAYSQLAHYPRYLKAMTLRLDKLRADPQRDATKLAELRPLDQRFWRRVQERKGQWDSGMTDMRWLLEELRVSFFAQELKTPYPVSVKRLEKAWTQLEH
jgi:ATP-dependent helicase HrpA